MDAIFEAWPSWPKCEMHVRPMPEPMILNFIAFASIFNPNIISKLPTGSVCYKAFSPLLN